MNSTINTTEATTADLLAFFNTFAPGLGHQPVKKFADRKTAQRRVTGLLEEMKPTPAQEAEMEAFLDAHSPAPETDPATPAPANAATPTDGVFEPTTAEGISVTNVEVAVKPLVDNGAEKPSFWPAGWRQFTAEGKCPVCGSDEVFNGESPEGVVKNEDHVRGCHHCDWWHDDRLAPVDAKRSEGVKTSWLDPEVAAARAQRNNVKVDGVVYQSVRAAFKALGLNDAKHIAFRLELKAQGEGVFEGHDFELIPAEVKTPKVGKRAAAKAAKEAKAAIQAAVESQEAVEALVAKEKAAEQAAADEAAALEAIAKAKAK
jgi:hypothetical protein